VPKYDNEGTKCYEVKDTRKQLTVTMGGLQRRLQHDGDKKSASGNQTHIHSL